MIEKAVVRSSAVLFAHIDEAHKALAPFDGLIDKRAAALLDEVTAIYAMRVAQLAERAAEPSMTREETEASALLVECVNGSSFSSSPGAGA